MVFGDNLLAISKEQIVLKEKQFHRRLRMRSVLSSASMFSFPLEKLIIAYLETSWPAVLLMDKNEIHF